MSTDWVEQPVLRSCDGEQLVGILSMPAAAESARDIGVLIVVGGPQVRCGSHRQFVQLARALASHGWPVLRFDVRGMGDSSGPLRSFEQLTPDIAAGVDALTAASPGLRGIVLWGLCDGASAGLLYLHDTRDARVAALCLVNPWVRSEATLARTHVKHYYRDRLLQREFWTKLLSGRVGFGALRGLASNLATAMRRSPLHATAPAARRPYQARMAAAWASFSGPILLALSGDDYTAKEFVEHAGSAPEWRGLLTRPRVTRHDFDGADHTFSSTGTRVELERATAAWLSRLTASGEVLA